MRGLLPGCLKLTGKRCISISHQMFKKVAGKIHLWLGFASGLVLVLSLLPAAIFVFQAELTTWWYHDTVYADTVKTKTIPVSVLLKQAQAASGKDEPLSGIQLSNNANRNYAFSAYRQSKKPGLTFFSEYDYGKEVYINPYTGKVQGEISFKTNWIYLCRVMHQQMLLRYDIGHWFIGVASLIIIVSLISGVILWFPKNKAGFKQRFTIKWDARWRRKNYDIHNVGGFYSFLLIFILATTGLVWSFTWWANGLYSLVGGLPKTEHVQKVKPAPIARSGKDPLDIAFADVLSKRKNWTELYISLPEIINDDHQEQTVAFYLSFNDHSGWDEGDSYEYDPKTGVLKQQTQQEFKNTAEKLQNSIYGIHTGSIYGMPTKILVFLGTLFCASLPVTGFIIWWGRRKKEKKPVVKSKSINSKANNGNAKLGYVPRRAVAQM